MISNTELISILNKHDILAWDLDETLINGKNSDFFQRYVLFHPEKEHNIVTYRTGKDLDLIFDDLGSHFKGYNSEIFSNIYSVPEQMDRDYYNLSIKARQLCDKEFVPDQTFYRKFKIDREEVKEVCNAYKEWKPKTCSEIGASILIDDLYKHLKNACELYNVQLIDALQYIQTPNLKKKVSLDF